MLSDPNSSTGARRRRESGKALKFIHCSTTGSFFGAWDYISSKAPKELVTEFLVGSRACAANHYVITESVRYVMSKSSATSASVVYAFVIPFGKCRNATELLKLAIFCLHGVRLISEQFVLIVFERL